MGSPASDAIGILQSLSICHILNANTTSTIWLARIGKSVEIPDRLVVAYDTGGFTPNAKWLLDEPTIQILVRSGKDEYGEGFNKALEVKNALLGLDPQAVGTAGDWWSGVTQMSDINFLRYDDNDRAVFSVNFRIFLERAESVLSNRKPLDYVGP